VKLPARGEVRWGEVRRRLLSRWDRSPLSAVVDLHSRKWQAQAIDLDDLSAFLSGAAKPTAILLLLIWG
jgi:hypothetical protein